jgi:hypothetical protein
MMTQFPVILRRGAWQLAIVPACMGIADIGA